ncbi:hypothetical protein HOY82DRAFT_634069 [Tuber indicum]|nr:hypothetical protein HOY82DRAFT_634069 [Tuber indicum]
METIVSGTTITPLPEDAEYDSRDISDYITLILEQLRQEDAYGIFVGISENSGPVVPTIIIGIPDVVRAAFPLPLPPQNRPVWIRQDRFVLTAGPGAIWALNPVSNPGEITLDQVSVGIDQSLSGAGSFGGFLQKVGSPEKIFGITAAHCMPEGVLGTPVCSPSTIEVTSRLNRLRRYTTICPPSDRLHINNKKETEAQVTLQQFRYHDHAIGTTFLDPADSHNEKTGVLSGKSLGEIVCHESRSHEGLLKIYDQKIKALGFGRFWAGRYWKTRMDWCIFTCNADRCGGNIYEGDRIAEIGYLYPWAEVEKMGRSSGIHCGKVNPSILQRWQSEEVSYEISIIGKHEIFAEIGDSGGCVFVNENGRYKAAAILIGKTKNTGIVVATPLAMILDQAGDYEWA